MVNTRAVNLALQQRAILLTVEGARCTIRKGVLTCTLRLQPTPASRTYTIRLVYRHGKPPQVTVVEPALALHPGASGLPHVYPGDELCLNLPGEWRHDMLLAETIVPWSSEWLMCYEAWLVTGIWDGGGHIYKVETGTEMH